MRTGSTTMAISGIVDPPGRLSRHVLHWPANETAASSVSNFGTSSSEERVTLAPVLYVDPSHSEKETKMGGGGGEGRTPPTFNHPVFFWLSCGGNRENG